MSVAFTKEDSAETAAETLLPDRPVSPHPNMVTEAGLKALEAGLLQAREAYEAAQTIEDVNERRRQAAIPLRDARYFAARVRTAQVVANPASTDSVAFGSTVTFRRDDGRVQISYRGRGRGGPQGRLDFLRVAGGKVPDRQGGWGCLSGRPVRSSRSSRSRSASATADDVVSRCERREWLAVWAGHAWLLQQGLLHTFAPSIVIFLSDDIMFIGHRRIGWLRDCCLRARVTVRVTIWPAVSRAGAGSSFIVGCNDDQFALKKSDADRNYVVPPADHPEWGEVLRWIMKTERLQLIIPTVDSDIESLSRAQNFSANICSCQTKPC